ncbi:FAD-dependent oxidoreductase [Streptomyces sp. LX-29]|uniref:NAD(P)/FAD-dependent oxidoreductase n=1 Tax=Streptomyces sp. LX-29 TaxID=2900152 RepID=UPI00240D6879|nr:FAD-dependent oxidoreductase [Streptomyces sp. LX-29]WFB11911.1 FAD-dependent oxidoreductase [Streptomyces sp. LX-29]
MDRASAPPGRTPRAVDVLVVGAGPAGLTAAAYLAAWGAGAVEVVERESVVGGVRRRAPRSGLAAVGAGLPVGVASVRRRAEAAARAGARVRTGVTVTGWAGPLTVDLTGPGGLERITARAVVLATGARERPRGARLVPGGRPPGVFTAGQVERAVRGYGQPIGRRAVVVGAERAGYRAALTLRQAGVVIVAMVTDAPRPPAGAALDRAVRAWLGFPLLTDATVTGLTGRDRLESIGLRRSDGATAILGCDAVVFAGDWIPEHELARSAGIALDPGTRGPAVDAAFRTSRPGVFAAGAVVRPTASAATAVRDGRATATAVLRHLNRSSRQPEPPPMRLSG